MARPRSLTPSQIAQAALHVLKREGASALSMRSVAGELGVGTMSLYRYVEGREQLEALIVEEVAGKIDIALSSRAGLARNVKTLALRVREALGSHTELVPLLLTRRHAAPSSLRWGEAMLGLLGAAGFTGERRVIAFRTLLSYVLGALQVEHLSALSGEGTRALAQLPRDAFPELTDAAKHARNIGAEAEFLRGLDLVLKGLDASLG
jgi:AcrR family transcriptional regulator